MSKQEIENLIVEIETLEIENQCLMDTVIELECELDQLRDEAEFFTLIEQESSNTCRPVVRSINQELFHHPDCKWAGYIPDGSREDFSDREQAIAAGLKPCKTCKS